MLVLKDSACGYAAQQRGLDDKTGRRAVGYHYFGNPTNGYAKAILVQAVGIRLGREVAWLTRDDDLKESSFISMIAYATPDQWIASSTNPEQRVRSQVDQASRRPVRVDIFIHF